MKLSERISALARLGHYLTSLPPQEADLICSHAANENGWFTRDNVMMALKGVTKFLDENALCTWASKYPLEPTIPKTVGIVMAGNIPLVGFHDYLCVLISGHRSKIKLSSQDSFLLKHLQEKLLTFSPEFSDYVEFAERLHHIDAVIATGSDNTSRYFEYYFRNIPSIIRKNRTSVAVLLGEEPSSDLNTLGLDVFSYFGLGCRNVSKLYVPANYDFRGLLDSWESYQEIRHHHKYANNYDYQKSILLLNQDVFLDNGFVMINASTAFVSPISRLFYESYADQPELNKKLRSNESKIQCIVSAHGWFKGSHSFGDAQFPALNDYADNVDTLGFLQGI